MDTTVNHSQQSSMVAWLTCFAATLYFFYVIAQMGLFNALNEELMREFDLNASEISFIASLYFYVNALVVIPVGLLYDRFSTRKIILISMSACVLVTFVFVMWSTMSWLIIYRSLAGAGNAFAFIGFIRLISRWFPPHKAAMVTGALISIALLGGIFASTPIVLLTQYFDWQGAMLINAIIGFGFLVFVFFTLRDPQELHPVGVDTSETSRFLILRQLRQVISCKQNWNCGIYAGLMNLPIPVLATLWGNSYLIQTYDVSRPVAATISSMLFFGLIVGSPFFGVISDTMRKRRPVLIIGATGTLLAVLAMLYLPYWGVWSLIAIFFVLGFMLSAHVVAFPTVFESNSLALSSTAMGLVALLFNLIAGLSQPLFGALLDLNWDGAMLEGVKMYSAQNFYIALLMLPILFVVAWFLAFRVKETHCKISGD